MGCRSWHPTPWASIPLLPLLLARCIFAQNGVLDVLWSSDRPVSEVSPATFGPDGPWQAPVFRVGTQHRGQPQAGWRDFEYALWPSEYRRTLVSTAKVGGRYRPDDSPTAAPQLGSEAQNLQAGITMSGQIYIDVFEPILRQGLGPTANLSAVVVDDVNVRKGYPDPGTADAVGIMGLGPGSESSPKFGATPLLSQLRDAGSIFSQFFGLQIGSAALDLRGSLILGGYDRSRVLGRVGVFPRQSYGSFLVLLDVTLGHETGASPFRDTTAATTSIMGGLADVVGAEDSVQHAGAPKGSAIVMLTAENPYMGLPRATCDAAARHLPVRYDEQLRLYIWNTSSPDYHHIVQSPGYMGFVFGDADAVNLTIKVPFPLLDLELGPPLVDEGVALRYFPCSPATVSWDMVLGRAFLQAAFMGVSYDANLTFLAQAPGPDVGQPVMHRVAVENPTVESDDIRAFAATWRNHWTPIPDHGGNTDATFAGTLLSIVAAGAAAWIILLVLRRWWRRRRRRDIAAAALAHDWDGLEDSSTTLAEFVYELNGNAKQSQETGEVYELWCDIPQELSAGGRGPDARGVYQELAVEDEPGSSRVVRRMLPGVDDMETCKYRMPEGRG